MTILVTGSNGKTAARVAALLHARCIPFLLATRRLPLDGSLPVPALAHPRQVPAFSAPAVHFDWLDEGTWAEVLTGAGISAVYMVAPAFNGSPAEIMNKFVDFAMRRGVKRFVLLSATLIPEGGPLAGKVHSYLHELGDQGKVEWAVLRATWFMQNFGEQANYCDLIKRDNKIATASGKGRVPFVDTADVANVAVHALTSSTPPNTDYFVTGPQELTYADCAAILTHELGRDIKYQHLTWDERRDQWMTLGLNKINAAVIANADLSVSKGSEEGLKNAVEEVTGMKPRSFEDYVKEARSAWIA